MFQKIHRAPDGTMIVAVCDRELINTTITDGELTVRITEAFYGNCQVTEAEVKDALSSADSANIMGERSVAFAVEMGIVDLSSCIMIGNIPHAQVFRV